MKVLTVILSVKLGPRYLLVNHSRHRYVTRPAVNYGQHRLAQCLPHLDPIDLYLPIAVSLDYCLCCPDPPLGIADHKKLLLNHIEPETLETLFLPAIDHAVAFIN